MPPAAVVTVAVLKLLLYLQRGCDYECGAVVTRHVIGGIVGAVVAVVMS
jgi:hypothetical protein